MKKKKLFLKKYRSQLLMLFLALCLSDIFLIEFINDLIVLFLVSFSFLIIWLYRWSSYFLVVWAMVLLLPAAIFLIFRTPLVAEKIALWSYLLFTLVVFREVLVKIRDKWLAKK